MFSMSYKTRKGGTRLTARDPKCASLAVIIARRPLSNQRELALISGV